MPLDPLDSPGVQLSPVKCTQALFLDQPKLLEKDTLA